MRLTIVGVAVYAISFALFGCQAGGISGEAPLRFGTQAVPQRVVPDSREAARAIRHVIVIVQQNRSFDDLFAGFPHADAPTTGLESTGQRVRLRPVSLERKKHCGSWSQFPIAYDDGKMDGWNLLDPSDPLCPYTHVLRSETRPYWELAATYAIADRMFSSTHLPEFVDSLYLIAGTAKIAPSTYDLGPTPFGDCYSPPGTTTDILKNGTFERDRGPYPCFDQFRTIANLLDDAAVSWRWYYSGRSDSEWNPFGSIQYVAEGRDWDRNLSNPATNVFSDIARKRLRSVSWILSPVHDSDLPGYGGGPKWIAKIVSAVQKSSYWPHAALLIVWENSGFGDYDDAAPPQISAVGLGFRVPLLVISPYAKSGYVSHTDYQFGSILKFIEENWDLGSLGATDKRSHSIADMFRSGE